MKHPLRTNTARAGVAAMITLAGGLSTRPALAQEGGGGRVLERDLRVGVPGGQGLTPRANMMDEVRLRNAVITGNVGGLRAFRGNVGYTAPDEFRSRLGSDSTFSFRRDSASAQTIRNTDSLRFQYNGTTGYVSRLGATGDLAANAPPGTAETQRPRTSALQRQGVLRSTAAFTASRLLDPATVGYQLDSTTGETRAIAASSLTGIRPVLPRRDIISQAVREQLIDGVPPPLEEPEARPGLLQNLARPAERPDANKSLVRNLNEESPATRTVFDDLNDRISRTMNERDRSEEERPEAEPEQPRQPAGEDAAPAAAASSSAWDRKLAELREKLMPAQPGAKPGGSEQGAIDAETVDILRDAAGQTRTFIDPAAGKRDFYSESMVEGQRLLGESRYFDAEERFARALDMKPGDVTARAARLHAQLGAGLYLSAAINLRDLLTRNPEVVSLRFSGPTIPAPARLNSIAAELRSNFLRARDQRSQPVAGEGLLLAYVGWQTGDTSMIEQGLNVARTGALGSVDPKANAALVDLLESVWLAPQQPEQPAPKQQP